MSRSLKLLCTTLSCLAVLASCEMHETVERMFMSRKSGTDLTPEATGYIYRSDNQGPASFVPLGAQLINKHLDSFPAQYHNVAPLSAPLFAAPIPLAHAPLYTQASVPETVNSYGIVTEAKALPLVVKEEIPVKEEEAEDDSSDGLIQDKSYEFNDSNDAHDEGYAESDDDDSGYEAAFDADVAEHLGNKVGYGNVIYHALGDGHSHEKGAGSSYGSEGHSSYGGKGDKGYKSHNGFSKGEAGSYGKEGHEGHYSEGKGEKGAHFDESDAYGTHYEAAKGYKGGNHGHKKSHSKGEDITGFHKVYNKDEFKKNHKFYDEAGNEGDFKKYGSGDAKHGSASGGFKKGGHHDSANAEKGFGTKGYSTKGHQDVADSGYGKKEGDESYYQHSADFGSKVDSSAAKESAFKSDY